MKKILLTIALISATTLCFSLQTGIFSSWDSLVKDSGNILIVKCDLVKSSNGSEKLFDTKGVLHSFKITIISTLKGDSENESALMRSFYCPFQGEQMLVFANSHKTNNGETEYDAIEDFRTIPLGHYFDTNTLSGKTLNQQIAWILNHRLKDLNDEIARGNEEKQRLEAGMIKGSSDVNMTNNVPQPIPKRPLTGGTSF